MEKHESPVYNVIAVPIQKIKPNNYNPNSVAPPEMRLLYRSIKMDGYTMPIVCYYKKEEDEYIIVDGFHRYRVMLEHEDIFEREGGMLPVSVIDKPIDQRMASTIRHNRARGNHNVDLMSNIVKELHIEYPSFISSEETLEEALSTIYYETGSPFVIIFDEWDYPIRELEEDSPDRAVYIDFLRGLFKNSDAKDYIRLAYLTGILPIIRAKGQSAVNNFHEYTMVKAKDFAPYIGFTEEETRSLCEKYQIDFQKVKEWYNGYNLNGTAIYNPLSVVEAVANNDFDQHWTETGTYGDIRELINMNMDGVLDSILFMLSGEKIPLNTHGCKNDMHTFANKDQVITTLVHLGYIAYDNQTQEAYIPNKEVQRVFENYAAYGYPDRFTKFAGYSQEVLISIEHENAERVAELLQIMHNEFVSSIRYHDENSLCCVIMIAMLASLKTYHKAIREFPCGKGFADLVYLPLHKDINKPAIIMELKWNKSAETAITQIKERQYPKALEEYAGEILLVGIDYQKETKEHTCVIERCQK